MDFRQSEQFASYLKSSDWKTQRLTYGTYVYIFPLPLIGSIIRIPRVRPPINFNEILKVAKNHNAILIKLEPDALVDDAQLLFELKKNGFVLDKWSIEPTQTLVIDLTLPKEQLFSQLKPKMRQYVRFAQKSAIEVEESDDIQTFIKLWQTNALKKRHLTESSNQTLTLFREFINVKKAALLFAYYNKQPIAGAFMIFWGMTCHLWHLAFSGLHENLRPLHLLIWNSILFAKSKNMNRFDFEGIEDPRFPYSKKTQPTFFKKGFGGYEKQYIGSYIKYLKPLYCLPYMLISRLNPGIFRYFVKKRYG